MRSLRALAILILATPSALWAQEAAPAAVAAPAAAPAPAAPAAPAEAAPPPAEAAPPPTPPLTDIRQVQIKCWIGETNDVGLRSLGANLVYQRQVNGVETGQSVAEVSTNLLSTRENGKDVPPWVSVTLPTPQANPNPNTPNITWDALRPAGIQPNGVGITFDILDVSDGTLNGAFRGIEKNRDSDLISKPEVLVQNGQAATISAGDEIPYQSIQYKDGRGQVLVTFKPVGVNMELTPEILSEDLVKVNLTKLEVSELDRAQTADFEGLPVFSTRSQIGSVLVPNGQSIVIGGLSTRRIARTERRVPLVGKVPVLGIPFRQRSNRIENAHLLIFLSPTIVDLRQLRPEAVRALSFWRDDRWQHMEVIEEQVDSMDEEL